MFFVKGHSKKHETTRKTGRCNWPPKDVKSLGYQISPNFTTESLAAEFCDLCKGKHEDIVPLAIIRATVLVDAFNVKVKSKPGKFKIEQTVMQTFENPYKKPKKQKE